MALTIVLSLVLGATCDIAKATVTPLIWREYGGEASQLEYLPTGVLYQPPGQESYQKIQTTTTVSISTDFSSTVGGVVAGGSSQMSMSYSSSWQTSSTSGDVVVGQIWDLTWDVWFVVVGLHYPQHYFEYDLVSSKEVGGFSLSRQDLASLSNGNTQVEDLNGQAGAYQYLEQISAGVAHEKSITYSWSGSITTGFDFDVSILGLQSVEMSYTITASGTQSFSVTNHYQDNQNLLQFYENAQSADSSVTNVYSYVFWFSPYS